MGKRDTVSLRLRPGERTAIDTVKLILEREADQDVVQTLIRQRIREILTAPEYQDRIENLGIDKAEALAALEADLRRRATVAGED